MTSLPKTTSDLEEKSRAFAGEIGDLLMGTLGVNKQIVSVEFRDRFAVRPAGKTEREQLIPLKVGGEHLADLALSLYQTLDRSGRHLKTVRSDLKVYSTLDRTPLMRLEYQAEMRKDPVTHWQVHAERGAFTHLLSMANANDARRVRRPHDLSTIHLPIGGERFRPCLEDFIEVLIRDCGIDHAPRWEQVIREGRRAWRLRQLRAAVRDQQVEAASALEAAGWTLVPPESLPTSHDAPFDRW